MTNSRKKPIVHISRPRDETHRRRERQAVRQALHVDIESDVPYRDPKELGNDEWGTWFGFDWFDEEEKKASRK